MATRSLRVLNQLKQFESRNVTYIDPGGGWPIVWERAKGMHVWDAEGSKYLDLTAAFGVAAAGHANTAVVRAGQKQMEKLLHAMGDVHPHRLKADLARELSRLTFERWSRQAGKCLAIDFALPRRESRDEGGCPASAGRPLSVKSSASSPPFRMKEREAGNNGISRKTRGKTIFGNSGFEAVEAALKTARLATGRKHVIAFRGGYHGLGYGALNTTHRRHFSEPFRNQLGRFGLFASFPTKPAELKNSERELRALFKKQKIGAMLVEPIQARGGINVPPQGFLRVLRELCNQFGALLVFDEIYTGFGRTGKWFACEHEGVIPDLVCLGKALTGGFPLSACVGHVGIMDAAWPSSDGEAIHTSTFLGHPVGCAMALAQINGIRKRKLPTVAKRSGTNFRRELEAMAEPKGYSLEARGVGLMLGLELRATNGAAATRESLEIIKRMLHRGYVLLPEGEHANVISFTPPLIIGEPQIKRTVRELSRVIKEVCGS